MENPTTLLVALMFITILTLGIASILVQLAEFIQSAEGRPKDRLVLGWLLLLLFAYFDLFWRTMDIALLEEWRFHLFLFAETGPVLLLFATQIAIGGATADSQTDTSVALRDRSFFWIFALVQLWGILAGFVLGAGFTLLSGLAAIIAGICVVLASTNRRRVHTLGLACVSLLYVAGAIVGN